jgi:hypothetical protein
VQISAHAHEALFKALNSEVAERFPEYAVVTDALAPETAGFGTPPELLSFLDQDALANRFREIIDASPSVKADLDLAFRWKRVRNRLRESNIYLGIDQIWIRPYIYPLVGVDHYRDAKQRLYMSATIGDPGDLSRRLGVRPIVKVPVPATFAQKTSGRRFIVMNRLEEAERDIQPRLEAALLTALRIHPKSVWLCSSQAEAEKWRNVVAEWLNGNELVGHETWLLTPLGDEIDQFKAAAKGHLFVGGRFDGMDFKADECRLVVLTTLPRAINVQEEFISAYLRDAGFMRRRLNQRIVQALGRCNRDDSDFGIYVLADRRFATHFGREANREDIPDTMVAEIDMAQDQAEITEAELCARVSDFLNQKFSRYDKELSEYRKALPVRTAAPVPPDASADEVIGWTALFANQNYDLAADHFEACSDICMKVNLIETGAFWKFNWAKALYLQASLGDVPSKQKALELLEDAIKRGGISSWFNRLTASLNRARAPGLQQNLAAPAEYGESLIRSFDDHLERLGAKGNKFEIFATRMTASLASEKHDEFCEGLEKLGSLLGYQAARPRYKAATDNRWRGTFGNSKELFTFEAKIQHDDGSEITPYHMGQAHNQLSRAITEFGGLGYVTRGTIVTHLDSVDASAKTSAGPIRIVQKMAIQSLWSRLRILLSHYRDGWSVDDVPARFKAAATIRAKCPSTGWLTRALDRDQLVITAADLLSEWPSP